MEKKLRKVKNVVDIILHKTGLDRRKEKKKKLEGTINLDR